MSRATVHPIRPGAKAEPQITPDNERVLRERLKTIDRDAKTATDWDKSAFLKRLQRRP